MSFKTNFQIIFLWGFSSIFSIFVFNRAIKDTHINIYFAGFILTTISMIFNIIRFIIIGETFDVAYLKKREILQVSILMIVERSILNFISQQFSLKILFWTKTISPVYSLLYRYYCGDYVSIYKTTGTIIVALLSFQLTFSRNLEYTSCIFGLFAALMSCIRITILKNTIENKTVEKVHFAISIISTLGFGIISLFIGSNSHPIINTELILSAILIWIASISSYKVLSFVERKITYDLIKNTWKIVGVLVSFFILHNTITNREIQLVAGLCASLFVYFAKELDYNLIKCTFTWCSCLLGTGLYTMHYTFSGCGIIAGTIILILASFASALTAFTLIDSTQNIGGKSFSSVINFVAPGLKIFESIDLYCYFLNGISAILFIKSTSSNDTTFMIVPSFVLVVSYIYTRLFSQYMHFLGILSFISCLFVVGSVFGEKSVQNQESELFDANKCLQLIIFFVTAFHTHMNIPVIIKTNKYKLDTHKKAIAIAFSVSFLLYLSVGVFSYSKFGITNNENILVMFSDSIGVRFIGSICPFASVVTNVMLIKSATRNHISYVKMIALMCIISTLLHDISFFSAIRTLIMFSCAMFFIPAMLEYKRGRSVAFGFYSCCGCVLVISCLSNLWKQECTQYVVVDAGSSGSRLHVFNSNYDEIFYKRIHPGISQFKNTHQAIRSIENLLYEIPKTKCSKHAYLHATAGVRLMQKNKRDELMSGLKHYLHEQNGIIWKNISILSGYEEAVNEWKAASYLSPDKSIGVIGLGGASLQIAFRQKNNNVFAKSWPLYGLNEAAKQLKQCEAPLKYEHCKRDIATYLKPIRDIPERKHIEFFYGLDNFPKVQRLLPKHYQLNFSTAKHICESEMEKCFSVLYVVSIMEKIKANKVVFEQKIEMNLKKWSLDWTLGIIIKSKKKLR